MIRNESERFLRSALDVWATFSDEILILDDSSTDNSKAIAEDAGACVLDAEMESLAWGREAPTRALLWEHAVSHSSEGDYIFILDADMIPAQSPRPLLDAEPDAVAFALFDLWGETEDGRRFFRNDSLWRGHLYPRVWLVKAPKKPQEPWEWSTRGIHTGHFPVNLPLERVMVAPREYSLLHYAYVSDDLRQEKASRYASVWDDLTAFERTHASSILDVSPQISPLPFHAPLRLDRSCKS